MESNKIIKLLILLLIISCQAFAQYQNDVLGNGFEQQKILMPDDYEGKVVITLVRKQQQHKKAVLYIHGFCDYFFQEELAKEYLANGFDFYAIDLRKYGRSTGGLIALAYAQAHGQKAHSHFYKLVLNSPFVDMNQSPFNEKIAIPTVSFLGRFFPKIKVPDGVSTLYGESIAKQYHGEWEYNMNWKPLVAFDVNAGWLHAIYQAQKSIQKNYQIKQAILVCCSDYATYEKVWSEKLQKGDAV